MDPTETAKNPGEGEESTHELLGDHGWAVRARVQVFWEGGQATYWLGPSAVITVGRSQCELRIDHPSVSRVHARLRGGSPIFIEDMGSANGVRVRSVHIRPGQAVAVFPGDVVELGAALLSVQQPPGIGRPSRPHSPEILTDTPNAMAAVGRLMELAAKSDISVLFLGETGVGKTVAARAMHQLSPRSQAPFVSLNCPAFPESLLESELFGHEKGAFTGATQAKPGLIESAAGGTVFLDEIGEMPLTTQAKLLSVVESREVLRLGSIKPRKVDVRFLAATNRDIEAHIAAGAFRRDLYFRLNGLSISIPPLCERPAEIAPLARQFLEQAAARVGRPPPLLSDAAIALLKTQRWVGNLRELRNSVERAVVLCPVPVLEPEHFLSFDSSRQLSQPPPPSSAPLQPIPPPSAVGTQAASERTLRGEVEALERRRIIEVLEKCGGNQTHAAKELGMSRRALIARIETYGLPRRRKRV